MEIIQLEGGKEGLFNKMNKNIIAAMLFVFIVAKSPLGLAEVKIAYAEPQVIETNALGEANIARNIEKTYRVDRLPTTEEKAKIELASYQKSIADEKARIEAEKAAERAKAIQAQAAVAANKATQRVVVTTSGGFDSIYAEAEKIYGVPRQVIAAVHYVETGQRGDTTVASYAGAQGPMQFMPSTFRAYAQDGDGDGLALINDVHDAIYTAAKYLAANGAASGNVSGALYRYNHSYSYVEHVLSIARSFGYTG